MNIQDIKKLIEIFDSSSSVKLKIVNDGFEIVLEKNDDSVYSNGNIDNNVLPNVIREANVNKSIPATDIVIENNVNITKDMIKSPMVGTFYRSPSPDSPPYVNVGDIIKKGQTVAIIEAMKIMNEIEAEFDCKIIEILVSDAKGVEFDTPLFVIEKI